MANRPGAYGLTAEADARMAAKLDPELEYQVRAWIEAVVGEPLASDDTIETLKDGTVLCKLVNKIKPGAVAKISPSKLAFKQMENINFFLEAAKAFGCGCVCVFVFSFFFWCTGWW